MDGGVLRYAAAELRAGSEHLVELHGSLLRSHCIDCGTEAIDTADGRHVTTAYIGQPHRWLAPVGAADFDADGRIEIAYVDRPHLLETLRLVRLEGRELREIAALRGVTNHRIGWNYIVGGVRTCSARPEMILATGDWSTNLSVYWRADQSRLDTRAEGRFTGPASMDKLLRCDG